VKDNEGTNVGHKAQYPIVVSSYCWLPSPIATLESAKM
jgi:hypothetical protein